MRTPEFLICPEPGGQTWRLITVSGLIVVRGLTSMQARLWHERLIGGPKAAST